MVLREASAHDLPMYHIVGEGRVHACLREHRKQISDGCRREEMILEQQEAEHIELRPNLLKACSNERQTFCGSVPPGSARVFRWEPGSINQQGCCLDLLFAAAQSRRAFTITTAGHRQSDSETELKCQNRC